MGTVVIWVVLELRQSVNYRPEAVTADKGSRPFLRLAVLVGVVMAIVVSRAAPGAAIRPGASWIGLGLLWCGIALRFWSFRTLGRYFTFTVQTSTDQPVITDGPYRVIRHPSYAGVLLAVMGLGLSTLKLVVARLSHRCRDMRPRVPDPGGGASPTAGSRG